MQEHFKRRKDCHSVQTGFSFGLKADISCGKRCGWIQAEYNPNSVADLIISKQDHRVQRDPMEGEKIILGVTCL